MLCLTGRVGHTPIAQSTCPGDRRLTPLDHVSYQTSKASDNARRVAVARSHSFHLKWGNFHEDTIAYHFRRLRRRATKLLGRRRAAGKTGTNAQRTDEGRNRHLGP